MSALILHVRLGFRIACDLCGVTEFLTLEADAIEGFEAHGWTAEDGTVKCPSCSESPAK